MFMWSRERMDAYLRQNGIRVSAANRQWLRVQLRREAVKKKRVRKQHKREAVKKKRVRKQHKRERSRLRHRPMVLHGTVTGRFSSSSRDIPLRDVHRPSRSLFPVRVIDVGDYSKIERRILDILSRKKE